MAVDEVRSDEVPAHGRPPHANPVEAVARALACDLDHGLTSDEAAARLRTVGPNRLAEPTHPQYRAIVLRQLYDPLVALLLVAAGVSAAIGQGVEAAVIAAIVVLNALLGFIQEAGAEQAVLALGGTVEEDATVVRGNRRYKVPFERVVPGDLVFVREGDRAPADARVVVAESLAVDESALTGESAPVSKTTDAVSLESALGERRSMLYAGTSITRGQGSAVVTATGSATEMGRIGALTAAARPPPTPLQRRLAELSRKLALLGLVLTLALTVGMLVRGASFGDAFLVGVSVAVAAVPEGLAAVVTIALAQGARAMARRGAIVRRLSAIETLGEATVIATDKTGTLTLNQLSVVATEAAPDHTADDVLSVGALASSGVLLEEDGSARFAGDPVDAALLAAAEERGLLGTEATRIGEIPFDPKRRRMAVFYIQNGRRRIAVKGAHETVLASGSLPDSARRALEQTAARWAGEGLRVLAVGERWLDGGGSADVEQDVEIVGLVGLQDPLRPSSADAVRTARLAGIDVLMVTGDHAATASSIGASLGLGDPSPVTGAQLERMDEPTLRLATAERKVFARVAPDHKLRLVESLQRAGHIVAVTGDGINDAPALRRANVGVAMGRSGAEAARQAADVVLTDDDFATIIAAVREGRVIGDNLRKFVAFLLSANLGEIVLFAIAVVAGLGVPMTVVQVLMVNLLTDGLPAVALTRDPASTATMRRLPSPLGTLFGPELSLALAVAGFAIGLAATAAFVVGRTFAPEEAQTMAFATIALAELVFVYSIRSPSRPAWRGPRNRTLALSVLASCALVLLGLYLPLAHKLLGTAPLGIVELGIVVALAVAPSVLVEAAKVLHRRRAEGR